MIFDIGFLQPGTPARISRVSLRGMRSRNSRRHSESRQLYIQSWLKLLKKIRGRSSVLPQTRSGLLILILGFHPAFALNAQAERNPANAQSSDQPRPSTASGTASPTTAAFMTPSHG